MQPKLRNALITVFLVLLVDQFSKFYIKMNFLYGEEIHMIGSWARLTFLENEGMAWGAKLPVPHAKLVLSLFRVVAVSALGYYLSRIIKKGEHGLYVISIALIFAGALGNIIDSTFYGVWFESSLYNGEPAKFITQDGFTQGYAGWFYGNVVDMLHFPMFSGKFPEWMPFWGGDRFTFFSPVFNVADTAISTGVGIILVFQKRLFPNK